MARAGAVPKFAGRIPPVGILGLLVRPRLVLVGMATCAIRLEGREAPVHGLGVTLVTSGAGEVAAVVERFVRQTRMVIVNGRPGVGVMAQATVLVRIEVTRILSRRRGAVVAGRTGAQDLVVIDGGDRRPGVGAMAILTHIGGLDVQRRIGRFLNSSKSLTPSFAVGRTSINTVLELKTSYPVWTGMCRTGSGD